MNKLEINAEDQTLRDILSNGKQYFVPKFQRDYSWERTQWEDLWDDIQLLVNKEEAYHYMGYLVIQPANNSSPSTPSKIIDGQQRMTTLSLLVLAAIKRLEAIGEEDERIEEFRKNFIGSKDLVKLEIKNKLTLNRNNDYYYKQAIEGNDLPQRGKKNTVHLMEKAIKFFYEKFSAEKKGEEIGRIIETISSNFLFTTIYIGNELNAYKIFETLNARGVQLSSSDLLKNYIFSLIDKDKNIPNDVIDDLDEKWAQIGNDLGNHNYTDYILTEWNSRHKLVRKTSLFKSIRQSIKNAGAANSYLNDLATRSSVYAALRDADAEFWKDDPKYKDIKYNLSFLGLFNVKQPLSLLLIAYLNQEKHFATILNWICIFSLRYNIICRLHTGEQEKLYNDICLAINDGCNLQDIKKKIYGLYPSNEKFIQSFIDKTMPTEQSNKKVRHLLAKLENHAGVQCDPEHLTVEHILPLNPNDQWMDAFGDNWNVFKSRIGNMTLVTSAENKKLEQKPFAEKREILLKSHYSINKNLEPYQEWNPDTVESRQKELAKIAVQLWRID